MAGAGGALSRFGGALRRAVGLQTKAVGPGGNYWLPISGGALPPDAPWNFWQLGWDPIPLGRSSVVAACIAAYAQTLATCPGTHWRRQPDNGRERVTTSALSRILKRPNSYETISDFMLNFTSDLYAEGNAYAVAIRNSRFEVAELHRMDARTTRPIVSVTGEIFYSVSGNPIIEKQIPREFLNAVPARDVLHVKLNVVQPYSLMGEPPLTAALLDVAASNAMVQRALNYVSNQGRPSGILYSDDQLDADQMRQTRAYWDSMTRGAATGNTVILSKGLKWEPSNVSNRDEQLAEILQLSDQRIGTVFRIPMALLNLVTGQVPQSSTESLMGFWVAAGFGFCLRHIETGIGQFFGLAGAPDEYLEFDTRALLRSNQKDRIEALARGVQGGIYAPNEARAMEGLPEAEDGDEPRVQQQVVPLSFGAKEPPPPAAPAPPQPANDAGQGDEGDGTANAAAFAASIRAAAERYRHS